jgi:mono/diheme cytochrome c family protein
MPRVHTLPVEAISMRVRARTILLGIVGLLVLVVLGGITAMGWQIVLGPDMRPLTSRTFEKTPARMARGQYLVENVAHCFHCHSDHDLTDPEYPLKQDVKGAGWQLPVPEVGTIYTPNITPDPETGIGTWSDDAVARAIQEGVDVNGRALFPIMPYLQFRELDDEDLASVVVYVRSIPAVKHFVPKSTLVTPLNLLVKTMPKPLASHPAPPARTTAVERGHYLVTTAGCADCHTPIDDKGQPLPHMDFAGGSLFHDPGQNMKTLVSMNITPDPSGISHYDENLLTQTLRTGQMGGRTISHLMPFEAFKGMTDDDIRDIFAYLKTIAPVKHRVNNTDPPALCPICKQVHGLGDKNVAPTK